MLSDLVTISLSWLLLTSFALISAPWVARLSARFLPDAGWAWSRLLGWLAVATPIWFLAHLGLPINTTLGVWSILLLGLALSLWSFYRHQRYLTKIWQKAKPYIIIEEILFATGFLFLSFMRAWQPEINGLEKFMDAGLIQAYLIAPTLPVHDFWLAGFDFNYYTFGHFLGAIATQVLRQPLAISYNLLLAFLMALMLSQVFAFVVALGKNFASTRRLVSAGLISAALVVFGGNSQHLWFFLKNFSWQNYWYPDATRFIPGTIHEFPAYSFIVSDLHAHVWSMILVLLLLPLLWIWVQLLWEPPRQLGSTKLKQEWGWAVAIGLLLGLITSTSTWDTLIYGLLLALLGLGLLLLSRGRLLRRLSESALLIGGATLLGASPWLLSFSSISEGVRLVTERSTLSAWLTLWTTHLLLSASAFALATWLFRRQIKRRAELFFLLALIVLAWLLLLLPEFFYMKDIYPSHPRANTMFKLTFQAFILMNLILGWLMAALDSPLLKKRLAQLAFYLIVFLAALLLIYPYFGYRDYYNLKAGGYQSLDGLAWLARDQADDFAALTWLKQTQTKAKSVILEAVGESYTTYSRFSAFSGLPTVLGWPVHEWLWRGSYDLPGQRLEEVKQIYLSPEQPSSLEALRRYQVKLIIVGAKEREAYPNLDEPGLRRLGEVVFSQGNTYIIQVRPINDRNSTPLIAPR